MQVKGLRKLLLSSLKSTPQLNPDSHLGDGVGSTGDVFVNARYNKTRKRDQSILGKIWVFAWQQRCCDTYERTIATVHPHCICYQIDLGPIFTGNSTVMSQIPVQHHLPIATLRNDVPIGVKRPYSGQRQLHPSILNG